jgi:hypothetical protein
MDPELGSGRWCALSKHSGHSRAGKASLYQRFRSLNGAAYSQNACIKQGISSAWVMSAQERTSGSQTALLRCAQNMTRHHRGADPKNRLNQAFPWPRRFAGRIAIGWKSRVWAKVVMMIVPRL